MVGAERVAGPGLFEWPHGLWRADHCLLLLGFWWRLATQLTAEGEESPPVISPDYLTLESPHTQTIGVPRVILRAVSGNSAHNPNQRN